MKSALSPFSLLPGRVALDEELAGRGGETTAVVVFVDSDRVRGASVGDSAAWLISPAGEMTDLTVH